MLTPSPSIRSRRDFPGPVLPSPQVTPQSLMPPARRPSPPRHAASRSPSASAMGRVLVMQTPPTKMRKASGAARVPDPSTPFSTAPPSVLKARADDEDACFAQPFASLPMTPIKSSSAVAARGSDDLKTPGRHAALGGSVESEIPCMTPPRMRTQFATPSQTPKRKRGDDDSPTQSVPQTPASNRQPVRVMRTPASLKAERAAARTPGRTPKKELIVSGSTASPQVRRAILAHARSPKFEGALPIVQMRVASRSPAPTPEKAVLRDVHGKHAHCASVPATPASARSTQSRMIPHASPLASKRAVSFASPVADAAAFYAPSPKGKSRVSSGRGISGKGSVVGGLRMEGERSNVGGKKASDAAVLAASIMDDDMAALLQRNAKSAAKQKVEQDPKTVRRNIEQVRLRLMPMCAITLLHRSNDDGSGCRRRANSCLPCTNSCVGNLRGGTA